MVIQAAWSHHVHSRQVDRSAAAAAAASVAATGSRRTNGRLSNVLYDAFEDEEDAGAAGVTEAPPAAPLLDAHGPELSNQLRYLIIPDRLQQQQHRLAVHSLGRLAAHEPTTTTTLCGPCQYPGMLERAGMPILSLRLMEDAGGGEKRPCIGMTQ